VSRLSQCSIRARLRDRSNACNGSLRLRRRLVRERHETQAHRREARAPHALGPLSPPTEGEEMTDTPNQLQHDTGPSGGQPCRRCGMSYSPSTAYIPCFIEGDTLATWLARNAEALSGAVVAAPKAHRWRAGSRTCDNCGRDYDWAAEPCGAPLPPGDARRTRGSPFCLDCGHPLTAADRQAPVCPYCGGS
jgi:hypothetical protein